VQPEKSSNGQRQACKKGHFFTAVVDCDHVRFAYAEKHTQDFVKKVFGSFTGFLQCDASNVYDILERGPPSEDDETVTLVGCWAHCRRYFFEAAICKHQVGVQGLLRIRAIYAADDAFRKLPPVKRKALDTHVRPLIESFFERVKTARHATLGRSLATKALGYAFNQEQELRRVLDDGRLPLDNTRSERSLRKIVVGRKNWMFYGSDTHAESAAAIFSLIASCRLHRLDAEQYLDEILRVLRPAVLALDSVPRARSEGLGRHPQKASRRRTRRPAMPVHCAAGLSVGAVRRHDGTVSTAHQDGFGAAVTKPRAGMTNLRANTSKGALWPAYRRGGATRRRGDPTGSSSIFCGRSAATNVLGSPMTRPSRPRSDAPKSPSRSAHVNLVSTDATPSSKTAS
jgi:hypothetical protein